MTDLSPDPSRFKLALRRLASGVSLIATEVDGVRHGLIATAVAPITAEPPTVMIAVNRTASILPHLDRAGRFSVNILAAAQSEIAQRFALPRDRETRFSLGTWTTLVTGAPVLCGAAASLDCVTRQVTDYGSHRLFFGEVVDSALIAEPLLPLVYHDGRYVALGVA